MGIHMKTHDLSLSPVSEDVGKQRSLQHSFRYSTYYPTISQIISEFDTASLKM